MSSQRLNPVSTVALGGGNSIHSGPSAHEILAQANAASGAYVGLSTAGNTLDIGLQTPSLQSGAKMKRIAVSVHLSGETEDVGSGAGPEIIYHNTHLENWLLGLDHKSIAVEGQPRLVFSYVVDGQIPDEWRIRLRRPAIDHVGSSTDDHGQPRGWDCFLYRLFVTAIWVRKPVVDVTNPTGTITNTSFPLLQWDVTYQDPEGGDVDEAEVAILSGSTVVASASLKGANGGPAPTSIRFTNKLANGSYTARVRVRQNPESNWSDYNTQAFTVNVVAPAAPTSVIVTPEPAQGRMKIDVVGSNTPRTVDAVEIERSNDGGTTFMPVRGMGITPVSGELVTWDFEAPIGVDVIYRARTLHAYALGEWASSDWVSSSPAHWDSTQWCLKHPFRWELNMKVQLHSLPTINRAARQGSFTVLGRPDPVTVSDSVRGLPSGTITFIETASHGAALDALLDTQSPLLLQGRASDRWPDRWITLGDQERTRVVDKAWSKADLGTYPWQEVVRPEGDMAVDTAPPVDPGGPEHLTIPFQIGDEIH